jgi:RimJ/RimL family protein N-acetyltransferase
MQWAFDAHDLVEIWASTQPANIRSRRVMEKLGMRLDPALTEHGDVRYRLQRGAVAGTAENVARM